MKKLVFQSKKGNPITSSRLVAQKFGKRHDHVLRDIKNLECSGKFSLLNFGESKYKTERGREYTEYLMTRDGFTFLVMGFTGKDAAKFKEEYFAAFDEVEGKKRLTKDTERITSLELAEMAGKQHSHLMRDIRQMEESWVKLDQSKFGLISYTDKNNRQKPMYSLTKTESLYIASKFNDTVRAKLVLRWEHLEKQQLKPKQQSNPMSDDELLCNAVLVAHRKINELSEQREAEKLRADQAEKKVEQLKPKAERYDSVVSCGKSIRMREAAKLLNFRNMGQNNLFRFLRNKSVLQGSNEPYQQFVDRGYFELIEGEKNGKMFLTTLVTQKGLVFIRKMLVNDGRPCNKSTAQGLVLCEN